MSRFTVFGASGFIGGHLVEHLRRQGHEVEALSRGAQPADRNLGHGVYCIGETAEFRKKPLATARSHVGVLAEILDRYAFESFLYLSSTRVYLDAAHACENTVLVAEPAKSDHVYNLTKLAGEAVCLASGPAGFRVARLSNVIGTRNSPSNFLPSLITDARRTGRVVLHTSAASSKDYVAVSDVVGMLERIALGGRHRIYNVASGRNTTNAEIAALLRERLGIDVSFDAHAPTKSFPQISIDRLVVEFAFVARPFVEVFEMGLESEALGAQ